MNDYKDGLTFPQNFLNNLVQRFVFTSSNGGEIPDWGIIVSQAFLTNIARNAKMLYLMSQLSKLAVLSKLLVMSV